MPPFIGAKPTVINHKELPSGPEAFVGAVYGIDETIKSKTGFTRARTIQYALHGSDADCVISNAWAYRLSDKPAVTACEIVLEGITP